MPIVSKLRLAHTAAQLGSEYYFVMNSCTDSVDVLSNYYIITNVYNKGLLKNHVILFLPGTDSNPPHC